MGVVPLATELVNCPVMLIAAHGRDAAGVAHHDYVCVGPVLVGVERCPPCPASSPPPEPMCLPSTMSALRFVFKVPLLTGTFPLALPAS